MNSPSESAETSTSNPHDSAASVETGTDSISIRVGQLVDQSANRTEFLKALASELLANFQSGIVAVSTSDWNNPMMLVVDDRLSQQIERAALVSLLETANRSPIACSISRVGDESPTRGLRVELAESPHRASLLVVYPHDQLPTPADQVRDLKRLGNYADCTRKLINALPTVIANAKPALQPDAAGQETLSGQTLSGQTLGRQTLGRQTLSGQTLGSHALTTSDNSSSGLSDQMSLADQRSLRSFHSDLNLDATGYRIASESRRMLQCDRVTVLVPRKGRYNVVAVSGVAVVDRRSNSVRAVERLIQSVVVLSRPLVVPSADPLPPQIQDPLDDYLDQSDVMSSVILPLHGKPSKEQDNDAEPAVDVDPFGSEGDIVGVIVLEYFSGNSPSGIGAAMTSVASEATLALANSTEHRNVFGLRLWKAVGTGLAHSKAPLFGALGIVAVCLLVAAAIIQVDHHVIATGKIEPTIRREVFASLDGIVKKLHVVDGQDVSKGDPLLTLENADLESQAESLSGEIQTVTERLAALSAMRLSENNADSNASQSSSSRLAMEERQLKSEQVNLRQQQDVVREQMKTLSVVAPIDGTIIGWQMERRLMDRPIGRGNLLISIVDESGPWALKLNIADDDAGPVIESHQVSGDLEVEFAVATLPSSTFSAEMHSISTAARMDSQGQHVIDALAKVSNGSDSDSVTNECDSFDPSMMRSGADVTAKIKCGKRSVIRSWFGDVFDFVHRNILFYF